MAPPSRLAIHTVPWARPRSTTGNHLEMADELLFSSQRVVPDVLLRSGFGFEHPTLEAALAAALHRKRN